MLNVRYSTRFKKDFKTCVKRGYQMPLLQQAIDTLRIPAPLPPKNINHEISRLNPRERKIVELRYGLKDADGNEMTQKEVADLLGISQSYISRLEKKIMKRLKKEIIRLEWPYTR